MSDRVFKIFIDFDGTVTTKDVGEEIFLKFGDPVKAYEIVERWAKDEINSAQSWQMLCDTVPGINQNEFDSFLDEIELDPGFKEFIQFCDDNNFELRILSDGLDYYIERVLKNNNLEHLEYYSNKLTIENDKLIPSFPNTDEECSLCGNCKRNQVINFSSDEDYTIYIGDGYSDKCPAQFCDFIFAKRSLLKYCEVNRITYFPFKNLSSVIKKIDELKNKKRLKKRHQAELKRKEVYTQG
ncbi:MtnX-like HAD-IB family phosphatase [Bacteroidota bacterium]